ncbi:MAG: carboxypeptidase-like regulatory domain-containing protein [Nostochopsis sp.]
MSKHQTITFLGRVIDQKKQAPISRAKVLLTYAGNSVITYTDLEGIYRLTINFNNSNSLQAQLSIQANGYKNYNSSIKLSSKQKDLGDVRLVEPNSNLNSSSNIVSSSSSSSSSSNKSSPTSSSSTSNKLSTNSNTQPQENSFVPLPIIIAIMMMMFLIMAITLKNPPQKNPTNRRNTVNYIY